MHNNMSYPKIISTMGGIIKFYNSCIVDTTIITLTTPLFL